MFFGIMAAKPCMDGFWGRNSTVTGPSGNIGQVSPEDLGPRALGQAGLCRSELLVLGGWQLEPVKFE